MLLIGTGGWLGLGIFFVICLIIPCLIFLWLKSVLRPQNPYPPLKNNLYPGKDIIGTCPVCSLEYSDLSHTHCLKDGTPLIVGSRRCF